jgi:hypothetical protein
MNPTAECKRNGYFHADPWYGLNDWEPVISFIRSLMEDSDVSWCFDYARKLVLGRTTPMSQSLAQFLGEMRDVRSIPILRDKLAQLGPDDLSLGTPMCDAGQPLEWVYLQALAMVGGDEVRQTVEAIARDPNKTYLHDRIKTLQIAKGPRKATVPLPADFPEVLKGIHSMNGVMRVDDDSTDGIPDWLNGTEEAEIAAQEIRRRRESSRTAEILRALQSLTFPGKTEYLSGDGKTRTFKLKHRFASRIHTPADPFSDLGVFCSGPKVEYPIGRQRWAHSHTFLHYSFPDGSFWNHEYTWDEAAGTITTHFREHIPCERVKLNEDGKSVTVANRPIATVIETRGNAFSLKCNSSVRGVWDNPEKKGTNYYARRANVLTGYKDLCQFSPLHWPLLNVFGCWIVDESEKPERFFDSKGDCTDIDSVVRELLIPLHEPKVLALSTESYVPSSPDDPYGKKLPRSLWPELMRVPNASKLDRLMGVKFKPSHCGLAGWQRDCDNGYNPFYDMNSDGVIDERDRAIVAAHAGEVYRHNMFQLSYYGENWVQTGYGCRSRNFAEDLPIYVLAYEYGGGYDAESGRIQLLETPPEGATLYAEYYYDAPAPSGKDNVKVYVMEPLD